MKFFLKYFLVLMVGFLGAFVIYNLNESDLAKFSYQSSLATISEIPKNISKSDTVSILSFGDGMFGRNVGKSIHEDNLDPFEFIRNAPGDIWQKADLITLNLEGPISDAEKCQEKPYSFRFEPDTANLLAVNKISLVNLSNNHSYDCYDKGLSDTRIFLDLAGIGYFGGGSIAESSVNREVNGKKIGFVGLDLTIDTRFNPKYLDLVKELKQENDFVIVNIHWGTEYNKDFTPTQKNVGRELIDAGADVIIGHHPHVIEPVEIYKDKPIFYSLGNFIFDQLQPENNEGIGVKINLNKNNSPTFEVLPYSIENMQPKLLDPYGSKTFCDSFLKNYTSNIVANCTIKF